MTLSGAQNATICDGQGVATILDDDGQPLLLDLSTADSLAQGNANARNTPISAGDLPPLVEEAISLWAAAGAGQESLDQLREVTFRVADLPDNMLAVTHPDRIVIDVDAAGVGWFTDTTQQPGGGHADLLTTVTHELGHVLLLDDVYRAGAQGIMAGILAVDTRRTPEVRPHDRPIIDRLFADPDSDLPPAFGIERHEDPSRPRQEAAAKRFAFARDSAIMESVVLDVAGRRASEAEQPGHEYRPHGPGFREAVDHLMEAALTGKHLPHGRAKAD